MRVEICANGLQSVLNAQNGGADCAELCESLEVGGVTPSHGILIKVSQVMQIPVRVLIRPRSGNYIYNDDDLDIMCHDIIFAKEIGFEGVVIGALNEKGMPDLPKLAVMMKAGEGMKFTFHRAIDACANPAEAIKQLIDLGFDKVLTSGGKPKAVEGIEMIKNLQQQFGNQINIMSGGGINSHNILKIAEETGVNNCHASLSRKVVDYHADMYSGEVDATGAVMSWTNSSLEEIISFVSICK